MRRGVEAVNLDSRTSDREKDAPGATADFQDGATRVLCELEIERCVDQIFHLGVGRVVVPGHDAVGIRKIFLGAHQSAGFAARDSAGRPWRCWRFSRLARMKAAKSG